MLSESGLLITPLCGVVDNVVGLKRKRTKVSVTVFFKHDSEKRGRQEEIDKRSTVHAIRKGSQGVVTAEAVRCSPDRAKHGRL